MQVYKSVSEVTPYITPRNGLKYTQLFQHFPILESFYFDYEKAFSAQHTTQFARDNWAIPLTLVTLYMVGIFGGQYLMKDKKPFGWKNALAAWNLFLSSFSAMGMIRTVPHLLHMIATQPFKDTICTSAEEQFGEGAVGLWVMLFIYSKIPELIDTLFIVCRKKPLIFLHWYHHVTVLLFCWHAYATESSTGLYFVAMNYTVHAIMYGYYFLMAINMKPKWLPPMAITMAQLSQMFVGVSVCISSYIYMSAGESCSVQRENVIAGAIMYGSYFYLFAEFMVKRFFLAPKKNAKKIN